MKCEQVHLAAMFLKNYTSNVAVSKTIYRIEQTLIKCRVNGITKEYSPTGQIAALFFQIPGNDGMTHNVRLPADSEGVLNALWENYCKTTPRRRKNKSDFLEQAGRTAWKIMQDWVEVQMSLIQLKQADPLQVFLSYVWDGKQTFYHALRANNFKALIPEKTA